MIATPAERLQSEVAAVGNERFTAREYGRGRVVHIVLFRYLPETLDGVRRDVLRRFLALAESRRAGERYIESIVGGPPVGGEGSESGFDHGFVATFASAGDRNYYVGEPLVDDPLYFDLVHADFKRFVGPLLAPGGVVVFDIAG